MRQPYHPQSRKMSASNRQVEIMQYQATLLDSLDDAVVSTDLDFTITSFNKAAEKIYGLCASEIIGKKHDEIFGFKLKKGNAQDVFAIIKNAGKWNGEGIFTRKDGKKIIIYAKVSTVYDEAGKKIGYVGIDKDITEQKKINSDLKTLLIAATKINNSVIITNSRRQIVWTNTAFTKNTGYSFEEVKGKVPGHFLQGKDTDQQTVKFMKETLLKKLPFECEIQNYKKGGEKFWMRIQVQPLYDNAGIITGFLGVGANITEQKKLQEKLIRQKVEEQVKITLATIAGQEKERNEMGRELHDNINQILAATKLQLECHLKSKDGKPECIRNSFDYVNLAIKEIRSLSKHLVAPRFHENTLLDEIALMTGNFGLNGKLKLDTSGFEEKEISEEVKLTIFRIIQEQLNNTVKYAKANSVIVKLSADKNSVDLLIKDDGIGFDSSQKRNGIGLSNIENRVGLYYGAMEIESTPGKGCQMKVVIPLKKQKIFD